jgi:hypothetical protein
MTCWLKRWWAWIALVVVAVVLGGRGQIESETLHQTVKEVQAISAVNHGLVTSLHAALVESCEINGNAQRSVQRETLHEEIHAARHIDPAVKKALNLPMAKFEELIDANVAKLRERLGRVKPVDCAQQYQISPGGVDHRQDHLDSSETP